MSDTQDELRFQATVGFVQLLETIGCSLAVSVYMSSSVVLVGAEDGKLHVRSTRFNRPMGMATRVDGDGTLRLALATFHEVVILADAPLLAASLPDHTPGSFRHLFVPRATLFSGDIDAHDLAWAGNDLYAANTRFSCISKIDGNFSFTPVWTPPFVTQVMPEDRCHLNGLATADGGIAYVSALGRSDMARGWNEGRLSGGLLLAMPSGELALGGLCMPHTPRVFDSQLYVLESGTGRVLQVDPAKKTARLLAELPAFVRGMDRLGDILFVGMSRIRERSTIKLPIQEKHEELICGVAAVERKEGRLLGWLRFEDAYEEIFDVKVLPKFRHGGMLSVNDDGHRRALVLPGRAFWGEKINQNEIAATPATHSPNK